MPWTELTRVCSSRVPDPGASIYPSPGSIVSAIGTVLAVVGVVGVVGAVGVAWCWGLLAGGHF